MAWLRKVPSIMPKCLADLRRDTDLYLVDEDIALFQSCCELMATLKGILCGCHRTLRFYLHCDQNQEVFKQPVSKDYIAVDFEQRRTPTAQEVDVNTLCEYVASKASDLVYGQALNFLNYFAELGGFTALLALLREGNQREPAEPEVKDVKEKQPSKELLPLDFVGDLTGAFVNCGLLMSENFSESFVAEVEAIVTQRLMGMRDKEIKELDKEALPAVLHSLSVFLQVAKDDDVIAELIEKIQLAFAARFLKTTYLEKRLKGVADLRTLIERV